MQLLFWVRCHFIGRSLYFRKLIVRLHLEKDRSPKGYRMTFFSATNNYRKELWDGLYAGAERVKQQWGADEVGT
jgi:hypothetical protein